LYFHGDLGVDDPVAMFRCVGSDCRGDYQWYFYGKDHLNTVEALWDSGTRPVASYAYSAFGLPTAPPSPLQPFTFTSREWIIDDLLDFRRRLYVSSTGRFASEDPVLVPYLNHRQENVLAIAFYLGQGMVFGWENLYPYVTNQPTMWNDPSGRVQIPIYGNWCGPGPKLQPGKEWPPTLDDVDICCKEHDLAYQKSCNASAMDNIVGTFNCKKCLCMKDKDNEFCRCLKLVRTVRTDRWSLIRQAVVRRWGCCMALQPCPRLPGSALCTWIWIVIYG
jgi:RHS repeat-associated protein